jgi:hypothetical protein
VAIEASDGSGASEGMYDVVTRRANLADSFDS